MAFVGSEVRRGETHIVTVLHLYCLLLEAFQIASKTIRQSTFVDSLGFQWLPPVYFLVAVCTYPLVRAYSRSITRAPFDRVVLGSTTLVAISMLVFWALFALPSAWVPFVFYVWISTVTIMMVSQFWTYTNQALDPPSGTTTLPLHPLRRPSGRHRRRPDRQIDLGPLRYEGHASRQHTSHRGNGGSHPDHRSVLEA
jgi:hypothetical protein